jgi:anti-anti-sigma factor|tara:strand:+ start:2229 stop:2585 length:357 start_codon:yes stop_codon:yes gene_type:complete
MSTKTLTTAIEKIAPTAILKIDGPFNDFHAKEVIGLFDDLLARDFVHFIINFNKCTEVNSYGVSVLISLIGAINKKNGKLIFTNVDQDLEKKLKMMGLAAYAEFYSEDKIALEALIEK